MLSKNQIEMIRQYMDPNGDGAIDIFELEAGFKRASKSSMQDSIEDEVLTTTASFFRLLKRLIDG